MSSGFPAGNKKNKEKNNIMKKTIQTGLLTLLAVILFWGCSSESYPGLEYENPEAILNGETPPDSVGLPIHVYVNEQATISLSASAAAREADITRGVGPFQIEEDEDIKKKREEGTLTDEEEKIMKLRRDTTTFYVFAFRDRKASQLYANDPDTKRLLDDPNLHNWYQMADKNIPGTVKGQDAQRLDCLIDGFDYNFGMPSTIDEEAQLKMKVQEYHPLYWSEYQGVSYNFFAYSVGDINRGEADRIQWGTPHRDADSIWYENFAVDGSQDLMAGYAPVITDELLNTRYKHIELTDGERKRILNDGNYTTFSAHRNVEPEIDLKHLLTRLRFRMLPGDSTATYTTVDTVFATTPYKGNLVVAVNSFEKLNQIGFKPDPNELADLYLHEKPKVDEEGHLLPADTLGVDSEGQHSVPWSADYWVRNAAGEIIGKKSLSDRGDPVPLGDALLIPEAEEIVISIKSTYKKEGRRFKSKYVISAKDQAGNDQTNDKYWDGSDQKFKFKRGYIYDITLVVYGLQEIQVIANVEGWKEGGTIHIDPDDSVDEEYID